MGGVRWDLELGLLVRANDALDIIEAWTPERRGYGSWLHPYCLYDPGNSGYEEEQYFAILCRHIVFHMPPLHHTLTASLHCLEFKVKTKRVV